MSRAKTLINYFPESFDPLNIARFFTNFERSTGRIPVISGSNAMINNPLGKVPIGTSGADISKIFTDNVLQGGTLDDMINKQVSDYVTKTFTTASQTPNPSNLKFKNQAQSQAFTDAYNTKLDAYKNNALNNSLNVIREHMSTPGSEGYGGFEGALNMWDYNVDNVRDVFGGNSDAFFFYTSSFLSQGRALGDELIVATLPLLTKELSNAWNARVSAGADSDSMLRKQRDILAEQQRQQAEAERMMREKEAAAQERVRKSQEAAQAAADNAARAKALADAARIRADNARGLSSAVGLSVSSGPNSFQNRNAVQSKPAEEINRKEIMGVNIVQGDTESQGPGKQKRRPLSTSLGINV